jgi:hypothetical protein
MGAAEFEFGALPNAAKAMRTRVDRLQIQEIKQSELPKDVTKRLWFLGEPEFRASAVAFVNDQLGPRKIWLKEPTRMSILLPNPPYAGTYNYCAWWALDVMTGTSYVSPIDPQFVSPWLIFVQKDDAKQFLKDLSR